jgi:uncharacterized membrane protein
LVHFYRGELGRIAIYRVRLDTTTNWAIGVVVAVLTFTLGSHEAPHTLLLLPYLLTTVFLFVESRRYRELDMFHSRVRNIEMGLFVPMFRDQPTFPDEIKESLAHSLEQTTPSLPLLHAIANRVRRNYLWLYLANLGGWYMKVYLEGARSIDDLAVGFLTGELVIILTFLMVVPWMVLAVFPRSPDTSISA